MIKKALARVKRKERVRKEILGTSKRPRLSLYRSLQHLYAQLIDDEVRRTLFGLSTLTKGFKGDGGNVKKAKAFGLLFASQAKERNFKGVVFDRGGFRYHGRVKAFAEGAREGGLEF